MTEFQQAIPTSTSAPVGEPCAAIRTQFTIETASANHPYVLATSFPLDADRWASWRPRGEELMRFDTIKFGRAQSDEAIRLLRLADGTLMLVDAIAERGGLVLYLAGASRQRLRELQRRIQKRLVRYPTPRDPAKVWIGSWSASNRTPRGAKQQVSALRMPTWKEVAANYPPAVRARLANIAAWRDFPLGRVMVWHGPPGTGKTTAIRALAREWAHWCSVEVVADPDRLFGGDSDYLAAVCNAPGIHNRKRLLVLEDAGELVSADARGQVGQALSRLLNVTDGITSSDDLAILITTNEPIKRLHPAILRPGRCLHQLHVTHHTAEEARHWLAARDSAMAPDALPNRPHTLAELYALDRGAVLDPTAGPREQLGFALQEPA